MNSTGQADTDLETMESGRRGRWRTGQGLVRRLDGIERKKGKQGKGQRNGHCNQTGQWGDTAKSCLEKRNRKAMEGEKGREKTRRKEKVRYAKVGDGVRKERGKGKDSKA